jgi:hypothetical protein
MMPETEVAEQILKIEREAMDRWGRGDPYGFLEISDPEVVYFDPFLPQRIDGLIALRQYYSAMRGKIFIDSYEIVEPKVQVHGEVALLTYRFVSHASGREMRWNTTEIYRLSIEGWRLILTHWSFTQPKLAGMPS